MVDPWIVPPYAPCLSTTSQAIQTRPTVSESPSTEESESTPAKRRRTASKEKQLSAGRVNAPRLPNGRYRPAKESASKPIQSVLAPNLSPRPKTLLKTNKENSPRKPEAAVENAPVKLVIKTPVYPNLSTSTHSSRIQPPHIITNPTASTMYSSSIFPFPSAEQIASDVIQSIILNFNCKSALETMIRKNNLIKFKPHIIKKVQSMLANTQSPTYRTLDEIVIACLRELGF